MHISFVILSFELIGLDHVYLTQVLTPVDSQGITLRMTSDDSSLVFLTVLDGLALGGCCIARILVSDNQASTINLSFIFTHRSVS